MKLTYRNLVYECVSAEKKPNEIVIHTGKYEEDVEIIYHIYGDINFDEVVLEGGAWAEPETPSEDSVWDELDAAYQRGVDSI